MDWFHEKVSADEEFKQDFSFFFFLRLMLFKSNQTYKVKFDVHDN